MYILSTGEMINLNIIYIVVGSIITWIITAISQIAAIASRALESKNTSEALESIPQKVGAPSLLLYVP